MESEIICQRDERQEQAIVHISAKVAAVIEMAENEKAVFADSLATLLYCLQGVNPAPG